MREIEVRIEQHGAAVAPGPAASLEDFYQLSQQLETIWTDPSTSVRLKKRIVRTLLEEVLVDVDSSASELVLTLHWKGGAHTELRLPRRRRGQCSTQTSRELIEAVGVLTRICSDDLIAGSEPQWSSYGARESLDARESHRTAQPSSHSLL